MFRLRERADADDRVQYDGQSALHDRVIERRAAAVEPIRPYLHACRREILARARPRPMATNQILLITGGSRGIGAATARLGAARGFAVCVNYRARRDAAQSTVQAIEQAGGRAIAVQG